MVERSHAEAWIDAYSHAWLTCDPTAIGELFADDAEYRYNPADPPVLGREAIVASWLSERDDPGTYHPDYHLYALDGDRAVYQGVSTYFTDDTHEAIAVVYDNCFLVEFDEEGRCERFTEWFVKRRRR